MNQIIYAGKHLLTYSVNTHAHSSWELIYCTGGEGRLLYNGKVLPYGPNDLLIIPPMVVHRNESETGFTNIHLNMVEPSLKLREPTLLHEDSNHFLLDAFSAVFFLFSSQSNRKGLLLACYAHLIINLITDRLEAPLHSSVVEEIVGCIIRNYPDENFELDRYLQTLPFNYDYLRKLFKREIGVTPHGLLSDTRLQAAAVRLSSAEPSETSISEIAHLCGFREPLYFTRMFKKKYGVSPSQFQQAQQQLRLGTGPETIKIYTDKS